MINNNWSEFFINEKNKEYFNNLMNIVNKKYNEVTVYPKYDKIFNAFTLCDFDNLKVVILGQDPYHEPNEAHGLAFSVPNDVKIPPSLRNIYKEISHEFNVDINQNGDLSYLATQGVLLLNSVLTVEAHKAGSHSNIGWEIFTDNVIKYISETKKNIVFLLWGSYAISKMKLIDSNKHLILTSPHPSPLSSYRGFFGNNHFKLCNEYLFKNHITQINWVK